jgi:uncharacterized membrane protein
MAIQFQDSPESVEAATAFLGALLGLAILAFFMIVAWRTMIAVEKTAGATEGVAKPSDENQDVT